MARQALEDACDSAAARITLARALALLEHGVKHLKIEDDAEAGAAFGMATAWIAQIMGAKEEAFLECCRESFHAAHELQKAMAHDGG